MSKKIVAIMGSPHSNGNLATSLSCLLAGAREDGAECITFDLSKMEIHPCLGCRKCVANGGICVLKDDMTEIFEEIKTADTVIFATPIYINQMSGLSKIFLDRMYPMTDEKHKPRFGTRVLTMLYTYGVPIPLLFSRYIRSTGKSLKAMGLIYKKRIAVYGCATLNKVKNDSTLQTRLKVIGRHL